MEALVKQKVLVPLLKGIWAFEVPRGASLRALGSRALACPDAHSRGGARHSDEAAAGPGKHGPGWVPWGPRPGSLRSQPRQPRLSSVAPHQLPLRSLWLCPLAWCLFDWRVGVNSDLLLHLVREPERCHKGETEAESRLA